MVITLLSNSPEGKQSCVLWPSLRPQTHTYLRKHRQGLPRNEGTSPVVLAGTLSAWDVPRMPLNLH